MKMQKSAIFVESNLKINVLKIKNSLKLEIIVIIQGKYRGVSHSICNLKYSVLKKIPIVFQNGSNYDYHFIIKKLAGDFKKQLTCLGENTEKYKTFTVPIEKEITRIDKIGADVTENTSYILQFIDSARFITRSLANLVNKFSKVIHKVKCKCRHNDKKCETSGIKYKCYDYFLEYTNFKDDLIEYKCLCFNKNCQQTLDGKLKEQFFNTSKYSNHDNNKFILMLRKGVYPYKYMDV